MLRIKKRGIVCMNKVKVCTKLQRQLLLYEIWFTSQEITIPDLMQRLKASRKTIQRDLEDLTDAGLIGIIYSRKEKIYRCIEVTGEISEPQGTARYSHLNKLRRLAIFMQELSEAAFNDYDEE